MSGHVEVLGLGLELFVYGLLFAFFNLGEGAEATIQETGTFAFFFLRFKHFQVLLEQV